MSLAFGEIGIICFLGLVLGSFATALFWRLPRHIPWASVFQNTEEKDRRALTRSFCPACHETLRYYDLVPVFSWLFLKGKCRYCRRKTGIHYPLIELATLFACLGVYFSWGFTVPAFIIMAALPFLIALFVIDLEHMILSNQAVFMAAVFAIIFILYQWVVCDSDCNLAQTVSLKLAGGVVFPALVWLIGRVTEFFFKKEMLGLGDIKFFAVAGLWLGLSYLPFYLICSGALGLLMGSVYRFLYKKEQFPFGPALIATLYIGIVLQGLEIVPLMGVQ
ncbi:MAG: prepilin peptidase [Alphaproteobacteria bacterium CG_4_9_14_3_um_filter_47_13]|nr:MAG: prepilin peptidase [Alphaproteobacteria bacterium CG_4_9_14_3_um_filter_47_13]